MLRCFTFLHFVFLWASASLIAQTSQPTIEELSQALQELQDQLAQVKSDHARRLADLEQRILQLSAAPPQSTFAAAPPQDVSSTGGQRTLQALNPEISVTGDVTARYSDNKQDPDFNRLNFDGFEIAFQHPLDPFSLAKFFVVFEEGEFELEEGYLTWESLPGNLGLKVGRFHADFGKLNRSHKHALPWANRDLPTQTLFGDEGLIGEGFSLSWLPPRLPWAQTNEISFEVMNNSNDLAFSGRGFGDPLFTGRLLNYYDVTDNAYLEWGLSAATSHWDIDKQNRSTVVGLDWTYRWEPLQRALYRWYGGLRYQFSQLLENQDESEWALSPFLTLWQSEWVRLRAQYDFLNRDFDENENRFFVQFTWSLGPHKHEAY
jgi:hypothetical protein